MSTELEPVLPLAAAAIDIDLVRRTVAPNATDDELMLFLHDCRRRGVHPLDKLLHFTRRKGRYVPIVSIDLFRSRAGATSQHAGTDDAVFVERDGERFPASAQVTVYRLVGGIRCPYSATARWAEYYPGNGADGFMWGKMPFTMLGKCAEALALRKAFPQELGGLYAPEEMDQASAPENGGYITGDQIAQLNELIVEKNVDLPRFLRWAQIDSLDLMPRVAFPNALNMLRLKKANGGAK